MDLKEYSETLTDPSIILNKETFDEKTEEFKPVNVYGKSFIHENSNHKRVVESILKTGMKYL